MDAQPQPVPPKIAMRPSLGLFAAVTVVFAGISGAAILFFFDPTKHNFYPLCQFHLLTGLYCPGCGATRASYQLLHGNFLTALHDNDLYVLSLMALALRGLWFLKKKILSPAGAFLYSSSCPVDLSGAGDGICGVAKPTGLFISCSIGRSAGAV